MSKKLTMTDVAKKCGVSQTLVSFVLSGKDYGISDSTRQKVLDTAAKLGYKAPTAELFKTIGVLIEKDYTPLSLSRVLAGIYYVLEKAGYSVILCGETANIKSGNSLPHKASGYILISADRAAITAFSERNLPFSFVRATSRNDEECGRSAAEAVLDVIEKRADIPDKNTIDSADIPGARSARRDSVWLL